MFRTGPGMGPPRVVIRVNRSVLLVRPWRERLGSRDVQGPGASGGGFPARWRRWPARIGLSESMGCTRGCGMVVRARAAIRAGSYRLQVPEHKFKSHPGVPPARLTELAHSPLVPSLICSMLPRGVGPHLRPRSESSKGGWG